MENSPSMQTAIEAIRDVVSRSPIRREIISLLLSGQPRKAIAARLNRSEHTIDDHIKAIYRATGTGDKARLAVIAVLSGIDLSPPPRIGGCLRNNSRSKVRIAGLAGFDIHSRRMCAVRASYFRIVNT